MDIPSALGGDGSWGNAHRAACVDQPVSLMLPCALYNTSRAVTEYRLEVVKPYVIIRPQAGNIDTLDVINVGEVIKIGEQTVDDILPLLKQKFTLRKRIRRALGARA